MRQRCFALLESACLARRKLTSSGALHRQPLPEAPLGGSQPAFGWDDLPASTLPTYYERQSTYLMSSL
jgi:hypothetical protein